MTSALHVGFTGTREGMSPKQFDALSEILSGLVHMFPKQENDWPGLVFHHGDCKGSDAEAHEIAYALGFWIVVHPPTNPKHRAFCAGDEILPEQGYLARDRAIVDACDRLLVAPLGPHAPRSGTWYTHDYAESLKRPITILERG